MSRNLLKGFRRKSSGNALDLQQTEPQPVVVTDEEGSNFKVFQRPEKVDPRNRASTFLPGRPGAYPLQHAAIKSADNLGHHLNRGSGGTTNSASSGYYDSSSARHSSSSTLPSSLDDPEGDLFSSMKKNKTLPPPAPLEPPQPSFTARAGRAFSFGLTKSRNSLSSPQLAVPYNHRSAGNPPSMTRPHSDESSRDRAMTASSYASTAKPPQLDSSIGTTDFGGEFGNMFDGLQKRSNAPPVPPLSQAVKKAKSNERSLSASPVDTVQEKDEPLFPPRTTSRPDLSPTPTTLAKSKSSERRFSWDSRKSSEQLMADSSGTNSPSSELFPSVPKLSGTAALTSLAAVRGYEAVPNRYASPELRDPRDSPRSNSGFLSAQSQRESNGSHDNLAALKNPSHERLAWASEPWASERSTVSGAAYEAQTPARRGLRKVVGQNSSEDRLSSNDADTVVPSLNGSSQEEEDAMDRTPRARKSIIDSDAAIAYLNGNSPNTDAGFFSPTKPHASTSTTPKKLSAAAYNQMKKAQSKAPVDDAGSKSDESDVDEFDDESDQVKAEKIKAQRRRQEASMSVYRQQMKKVTAGGSNISDLPSQAAPRPTERLSMTNLTLGMPSGRGSISPAEAPENEEDDDVPLGILQAHGFPNRTRPPSQFPGQQPGYASSVAGGTPGGLPAFARNLPRDPYYGAGLVNPAQRESLAFNSSGSVYGGPSSPHLGNGPPGGLVGVIANEEKARAGRRGSPNPVTGGYGPIALPQNLQGGPRMPGFNRTSSMASLSAPQSGMGGYFPPGAYPLTPMDQANMTTQQQMAHLMQMQTQMMQQMMALQAGQMAPQMALQMPPQTDPSFPMPSPSMQSLHQSPSGFLQAPHGGMNGQRPVSTISTGRPMSIAGQGRSMTMMHPPSNWGGDNAQGRANTMSGRASVYGMSLQPSAPGAGYQPSIAPSERSNVGMPSRYRPVSIMESPSTNFDDRRSKTMTAASFDPRSLSAIPRTPSPYNQTNGTTPPPVPEQKPKSTIRIIDKLKGTRTNHARPQKQEDEDDDAGWAMLARKREAMRARRATKKEDAQLAELYQGLDD